MCSALGSYIFVCLIDFVVVIARWNFYCCYLSLIIWRLWNFIF